MLTTVDVTDAELDTWSERLQSIGAWGAIALLSYIALTVLVAILISKKAGYSGWWGVVVALVPVLGPLLVLIFALVKWPALRERDDAVEALAKHREISAATAPAPSVPPTEAPEQPQVEK